MILFRDTLLSLSCQNPLHCSVTSSMEEYLSIVEQLILPNSMSWKEIDEWTNIDEELKIKKALILSSTQTTHHSKMSYL